MSLREKIITPCVNSYYDNILSELNEADSIYIFGASIGANRFFKWLEKNQCAYIIGKIKGVLDNNPEKQNCFLNGIGIYSPAILSKIDSKSKNSDYRNKVLIIITCDFAEVVLQQLKSYGIPEENSLIFRISYLEDYSQFPIFVSSRISELELVYNLLSDDKSKLVFENLINFRLSANFNYLEKITDNYEDQYFDKDLISFDTNDVYVDCGAYIGDTINQYMKHNGGTYGEIIAIEADSSNYNRLKQNTNSINNCTCVNKGVWNTTGTLYFNSSGSAASNCVSDEGSITIDVDTIDSVVKGKNVSHIKMDIEGSEVSALIGAYDTIVNYKPQLAICVYHNLEDYVRIPLLIKSMCPDYKIYFRHYQRMSAQETVCYAIRG